MVKPLLVLACAILALLPIEAGGQGAASAERLYADAVAKETAVRKALADPQASPIVLRAVRTVAVQYETIVRRFPRSGYCDDALWRGGHLLLEAFDQFGEARDRSAGIRLLGWLASEYPTSKLARQAPDLIASAEREPTPEPTRAVPIEPTTSEPTKPEITTITAIRRTVLPDAVRITIELDGEVSFRDERLESPLRVFVDLPGTRPAADLNDRTLRFESDADVVRQVRIRRHPNNTTRVVLDAVDISAYSVYPLYNPDRLVIDCIRQTPSTQAATLPAHPLPTDMTADAGPDPESRDTTPAASASTASPVPPPASNLEGGFSIGRQLGLGVSRIVIDPGHGGQDSGAIEKTLTEASLVLDIALRLERLLTRLPGLDVVLTRQADEHVPLQERTAIANREGADLFLSIHANSSTNRKASGIETYFLNFASSASAAAIAARENAASGRAMGALPDIVKAIALNNKLDESRDFATFVQRSMVEQLKPLNNAALDLGVKQAPFVVLIGAAMPSVLVEVSFLSNAQESKLLRSSSYRQHIADALFSAITTYQDSLTAVDTVAQQ